MQTFRPFTILGYSANNEVFCPHCLNSTTGLSPADLDYDSRAILPLYAGDPTLLEEACSYCHKSLLQLKLTAIADRAKAPLPFTVEKTRHPGSKRAPHLRRRPALEFDCRPPANVITDLKAAGWRWDPAVKLWYWPKPAPVIIPASVPVAAAPAAPVTPKPPTVRKRPAAAGIEASA